MYVTLPHGGNTNCHLNSVSCLIKIFIKTAIRIKTSLLRLNPSGELTS